jgi:hypothetical protein
MTAKSLETADCELCGVVSLELESVWLSFKGSSAWDSADELELGVRRILGDGLVLASVLWGTTRKRLLGGEWKWRRRVLLGPVVVFVPSFATRKVLMLGM